MLTRLSGAPCNSSDAHPLARVVKVILQRVAQRPIGWKAGTGAAELVPHLIQRFGVIACILDALKFGEICLAVRACKGPAHVASLACALARPAVRAMVSIVTKGSAYGSLAVPDDMGDLCVGVAVLPERPAELCAPFGHRLMMASHHFREPESPLEWRLEWRRQEIFCKILMREKGGWGGGGSEVAAAIVEGATTNKFFLIMRVLILTLLLSVAGAFHAHMLPVRGMQKTCVSPAHSRALTTAGARSTPIMAKEVVVKEDYRVAAGFAVTGLAILFAPIFIGGFLTVLGLFLVFQTFRIRFVFDGEAVGGMMSRTRSMKTRSRAAVGAIASVDLKCVSSSLTVPDRSEDQTTRQPL